MSWSVSFIGRPKAVAYALSTYADAWQPGQSKDEYEAAKPHLIALVEQNIGITGCVTLSANGHATITDGVKTYSTCYVSMANQGGTFVSDEGPSTATPEHAEGG